jgi:type VI secretion system VasD/TssJ family lipoprotein
MKKITVALLFLVQLFVLSSCGLLPPVSPAKWLHQKDGIILHIEADNKLNFTRGKAYTLYFVVYQLVDPNSFNQLSGDEDGLSRLLESKIYDSSVAAVQSMVLYPGSDVTYKIDRAEGARYVGVVAGYSVMAKERMVRLFDIPVYTKIDNLLELSRKLSPGQLCIDLYLGDNQIVDTNKEKK